MTPTVVNLPPYPDFATASRALLSLLQSQFDLGLWIVTRVNDDDWIVLEAANKDPRYQLAAGDVLRWSDSFCSRMVNREGPQVAPRAEEVQVYASSPIAQQVPIGSYIGIPLLRGDGTLFGTLCAIDPDPRDDDLHRAQPQVEVIGRVVSTLVEWETKQHDLERALEQAENLAMVDELTGLYNRRAWDRLREAEESRSRRIGSPACVVSIDLDDLKEINDSRGHPGGDELLKSAAAALRSAVREQDVVARVGGDEFAVLLVECNDGDASAVLERLRQSLDRSAVRASLGVARRDPSRDLDEAWARADAAMYEQKRGRKHPAP